MDSIQSIQAAVDTLGLRTIAELCGVRYQAVQQWIARGRLPRTEYTGETRYAVAIVAACQEKDPGSAVTVEALLGLESLRAVSNA